MIALVSEGIADYIGRPHAYGLDPLDISVIETPFGAVRVYTGAFDGKEFIYFPNSGMTETTNISNAALALFHVLREKRIDQLVWIGKVGALDDTLNVGDLLIPDDYLDFALGRKRSYWQSLDERITLHYEMTVPFCDRLRAGLLRAADGVKKRFKQLVSETHEKGVYVCTEGPAFESRSEVSMFKTLGAAVVGHTLVPFVYYAKELNMCFGALCIITNKCVSYGVRASTSRPLEKSKEVQEMFSSLYLSAITNVGGRECRCASGDHWLRKPTELT